MGCIIVVFWGWEKRQTKSTNKQTNKVDKNYLGWALTKFGNKIWEQILRLGTNKIFKQIWGTKYGKKIGPLNFFLLDKWK